jgi:hypothetical protein
MHFYIPGVQLPQNFLNSWFDWRLVGSVAGHELFNDSPQGRNG